jgi:DNA (cytosine-5)-methyltransferase 1
LGIKKDVTSALGTTQTPAIAYALCSHAAKSGDTTTDNEVVGCREQVVSLDAHMGMGGVDDNAAQAGHLVTHALTSAGSDASEDGTGRGTPIVECFQTRIARNGRGQPSEVSSALTSCEGGAHADSKPHVFGEGVGVRRLTPLECTRLQGFPDNYLDLDPPLADSTKYRLLGNAVAVPVVKWIGKRILESLQ